MKYSILTSVLFLGFSLSSQEMSHPIHIYLIPGMGTDHRVFNDYQFDNALIRATRIKWVDPQESTSLEEYAQLLSSQIDTTAPFILIGVSMGGMLAMELSRILNPEAIVLVSSARSSKGLPLKAKFGKYLPTYRLLTDKWLARVANIKWFPKDVKNKQHKLLYRSMLKDTGADFLKWQLNAIIHWSYALHSDDPPVFHIHGKKDRVLPLKKCVTADVVIEGGTHKMVVNRSEELVCLIEDFVKRALL